MMQKAGFDCRLVQDGRKVTGITYKANLQDVNKDLAKIYRELCKHCDAFKKLHKQLQPYSNRTGNELTDIWCTIMEDVYYAECSEMMQDAYKFSTSIVDKLTKVKEGF